MKKGVGLDDIDRRSGRIGLQSENIGRKDVPDRRRGEAVRSIVAVGDGGIPARGLVGGMSPNKVTSTLLDATLVIRALISVESRPLTPDQHSTTSTPMLNYAPSVTTR